MTRRGWTVLGSAFALWAGGRLFGVGELIQVATALAVTLLLAAASVHLRRRPLLAHRLGEPYVQRGDEARIEVLVKNLNPFPTAPLTLIQEFPNPLNSVSSTVPSISPRRTRTVATLLRPERRGRYRLGPLRIVVTDPFGLSQRTQLIEDPFELVVHPRIERLKAPEVVARHPGENAPGGLPESFGDDLYALREYAAGDDPRRVHWKTTARVGKLIVRDSEAEEGEQITLILDDRSSSYRIAEDFEWAVDAAASVAALFDRLGFEIRFVWGSGYQIPFGRGTSHFRLLLEALTSRSPIRRGGQLDGAGLRTIAHRGKAGLLVAITGDPSLWDTATLARAIARYRKPTVILSRGIRTRGIPDAVKTVARLRKAGARVVAPGMGQTLAEAWAESSRTKEEGRPQSSRGLNWKPSALT